VINFHAKIVEKTRTQWQSAGHQILFVRHARRALPLLREAQTLLNAFAASARRDLTVAHAHCAWQESLKRL